MPLSIWADTVKWICLLSGESLLIPADQADLRSVSASAEQWTQPAVLYGVVGWRVPIVDCQGGGGGFHVPFFFFF